MPSRQRRLFLRAIGTAMSVGIGGCAGQSVSSSGSDPTTATATDDTLTLPSVVTAGDLPDGQVRLIDPEAVTLLNFFTTWCRPCQREMPEFRELRAAYDADELHVVSITPEVDETLVEEFWVEYEGTWPVVIDPGLKATERWNANRYPTNLLFDTGGDPAGDEPRIRARTFEEFDALVEPLVAEA